MAVFDKSYFKTYYWWTINHKIKSCFIDICWGYREEKHTVLIRY